MTVVSRTVSTSHPAATPVLKALASLVGLNESSITFAAERLSAAGESISIEMKVTAHNSFSGTNIDYTANGLLGCARAICKAVPESGLWGQMAVYGIGSEVESQIESWIETASGSLVYPAYLASDVKGENR